MKLPCCFNGENGRILRKLVFWCRKWIFGGETGGKFVLWEKNRSGTLLKPLYSFAYLLISGSNQVDQILDSLRVNSRITVIILVNECPRYNF